MNSLLYICRFIYHIRLWLILAPIILATIVFYLTRNEPLIYEVNTSIYTGVISGENVIVSEPGSAMTSVQNAKMENMIVILTAANTLKKVSVKLYAECMIYGDPNQNNNYINASTYRKLLEKTPKEVYALIDKKSKEKTIANLTEYMNKNTENFVYGLFYWNDPHFSYSALSKIVVKRIGLSDMININYSSDDPGLAYNTLRILTGIFSKQYDEIRFAGTSDVINFFQDELSKVGKRLSLSEDSLTNYNIKNKVINYGEQTKQIAAMDRDFKLSYEDNLRKYYGSKALVDALEKRMGDNVKILKNNSEFLTRLKNISDLTTYITEMDMGIGPDTVKSAGGNVKKKLRDAEKEFKDFSDSFYREKYSKEGYPNDEIVNQWAEEVLSLQEYTAEKETLEAWKRDLDKQYEYYSPIGATLKRKEREIDFTEANYLSLLKGQNDAVLRQKNIAMTASTLKVVAPPTYPLSAKPTKRKMFVMAGYMAGLLLTLALFFVAELLSKTLKDKYRAKRLTKGQIIGAFPLLNFSKYRGYDESKNRIIAKQLANTLTFYFKDKSPQIINMLSIEKNEGKSYIARYLLEYWQEQGLKVKHIDWEADFIDKSRQLILGDNLKNIVDFSDSDILIVEFEYLNQQFISGNFLQDASVNMLVCNADRTWKNTDQEIYSKLLQLAKNIPLLIVLNFVSLSVSEEFTGLLPPYPKLRKFAYKFFHLGLNSSDDETSSDL